EPRSIYRWIVVAMLWLVCLFNYADRQAIFSVFPLLKSEMHLTDVQLGFVGSSFMWLYAAALPFAGIVGDMVSRKTLILGGLIFWSFITLATALSTQYWHLLLFRGLEGLRESFYFPASIFLTWMPSYLNRTFGMSLSMAGLNGTFWLQLASIFGVICGGLLADHLVRKHPGGRMLTQCIGLLLGIPFLFLTGWTLAVPT